MTSVEYPVPSRTVITAPGVPTEAWNDTVGDLATQGAASCLGLTRPGRVLVLAAHPDDETLGFGAAVADLVADGHEVLVGCLSDGAAAFAAVGLDVPDLVARRSGELDAALDRLGAHRADVDPLPDGMLAERAGELTELVSRLVEQTRPEVVVGTWAGDPHPDHAAVGRAVLTLVGPRIYGYPIWLTHAYRPESAPVDWTRLTAVRATPDGTAAKAAAIGAYLSQTEPLDDTVEAVLPPDVLARFRFLPELLVEENLRGGAAAS